MLPLVILVVVCFFLWAAKIKVVDAGIETRRFKRELKGLSGDEG